MATAPMSVAGRGPHPPQDEMKDSEGTQKAPPSGEEITVEAERGPHPPQDEP